MRLLAVTSYGVLGGAELALARTLEHRPAGADVAVLVVGDGPLRAHLAEREVPTWTAREPAGRPNASDVIAFTRALRRLLGHLEPDVVLAVGLKAAFLAVPACRVERVPLVWQKVDFSLDQTLTKPLAFSVNGVVAVSRAVAAALGPLRARRLLGIVGPPVAPVGLRAGFRYDAERRPPLIGTLGTLVPIKGHHHILRAASLLSDEFPDLRVILAGASSAHHPGYPASLVRLAEELGIAERVELPGFVAEPGRVLERLSVYINATYRDERGFGWEGLSGAMLEASWAGIPVVATAGGGTAEGLLDGRTGTLVGDPDPQLIAQAVARYLRDHALAAQSGAAGREFTRGRFAPDVVARRLFELLESARRGTGTPAGLTR